MKRKSATQKRRPPSLDRLGAYDGDDLLVVIETPKGSPNKLAFEPRFGAFVLKASCQREPSSHLILVSSRLRLATMATRLMFSS